MSLYEDLYIRMSLDDQGNVPRMVTGGISPDVIPYGNTEREDPIQYFTDTYDEYVSKDLLIGTQNFIYVRMKNYYAEGQEGVVHLYYCRDTELNNPTKWKNNILQTVSGQTSQTVAAATADDIIVAGEPFVWTPGQLPEGENWNLIAQVSTTQHPNKIVFRNFSTFVADNGGIGWQTPKLPPPVMNVLWSTVIPYTQGDTERVMDFSVTCSNIVIGSEVGFVSDKTTGPNPPIELKKTKVAQSPMFIAGIKSTVPAGYSGNITFSLYGVEGAKQPAGSYVKFTASYEEPAAGGNATAPIKTVVVATAKTIN